MATIKELRVFVGMTVDKKGVWVKGNTGLTINMEPGDDPKLCFQRAFEISEEALEEKMSEYLDDPKPEEGT